jgi:hypothetical protein
MIVFRIALYAANGGLLNASEAFPFEDPPDPQTVADLCARAADAGCTYDAGTILVWRDRETRPHERIEQTPQADGRRSFGPRHPPVPIYHWRRRPDSSIFLVPAEN